jgi:hypothetical protein
MAVNENAGFIEGMAPITMDSRLLRERIRDSQTQTRLLKRA